MPEFKIVEGFKFSDEASTGLGRPHGVIYPVLLALKVGQSFFFPSDKKFISEERALCNAMSRIRKNKRYALRTQKVEGGFQIGREAGLAPVRKHAPPGTGTRGAGKARRRKPR